MKRLWIYCSLVCFAGCHSPGGDDNHAKTTPAPSAATTMSLQPATQFTGETYHFDSSAQVNGCGMAYLQKISKDYGYELVLELKFDSIPKFREVNFDSSSKNIVVHLNKYLKGNTYINDICTDVARTIKGQRPPVKYTAITGRLAITKEDRKNFPLKVSIVLKNVIVKDSSGHQLMLSKEEFKDVLIGWYAG